MFDNDLMSLIFLWAFLFALTFFNSVATMSLIYKLKFDFWKNIRAKIHPTILKLVLFLISFLFNYNIFMIPKELEYSFYFSSAIYLVFASTTMRKALHYWPFVPWQRFINAGSRTKVIKITIFSVLLPLIPLFVIILLLNI